MVKVYSNSTEAELFVNGVSQGIRQRNSSDFQAAGLRWMVVLQEGQNTMQVAAEKDGVTVNDSITQVNQAATWAQPATVRPETLETNAETHSLPPTFLDP